ncbi:MAG: hypothetical protein NUV56_02845 [Candidatus Uhrbacteria bacterium]|nr:hypothetical protein [Candidatus Uhrbacteria bacterium]
MEDISDDIKEAFVQARQQIDTRIQTCNLSTRFALTAELADAVRLFEEPHPSLLTERRPMALRLEDAAVGEAVRGLRDIVEMLHGDVLHPRNAIVPEIYDGVYEGLKNIAAWHRLNVTWNIEPAPSPDMIDVFFSEMQACGLRGNWTAEARAAKRAGLNYRAVLELKSENGVTTTYRLAGEYILVDEQFVFRRDTPDALRGHAEKLRSEARALVAKANELNNKADETLRIVEELTSK